MHSHTLKQWQHGHHFNIIEAQGERNTWRVIVLTLFMMVAEIAAGLATGSMALLADGWHMGTHAFALGITAFAYYYARRQADNPRYTFGTGKVGALGGFASAVVLAVVALYMGVESIRRFFSPVPIHFNEAIFVAVIGLLVNVVSAFLLQENHHPAHEDDTEHEHHQDHNLRAAYLHVLADAVTSLLAIVALLAGKGFGWIWMDPIMGVVGAVVITRWSYGLLRETSKILLDSGVSQETISAIRTIIEEDSDNRVADLHVWRLGSYHLAAEISVVTHFPKPPSYYKEILEPFGLAHIIIEVNSCSGEPCLVPI